MKSLKKISILTALFAFILSFTFTTTQAQVTPETEALMVKGKVVDAEAATPLAEAEITVVGQDISIVSDQEGNFVLENLPAGEHTLKVELEGYQTWEKKMNLDADAELKIKLVPEKGDE